MRSYRPPLADRVGLRLDFNESTVGCSPRVLARLRSLDADVLARYPEREPAEKIAAGFLGLDAAQILLTNGVDEAIHLLCSTYLDAGDEALIVVPTFAMYAIFAEAEGARVIEARASDNFAFPLNALLAQRSPRTRLIAVANPNNPTGAAVAGDVLMQIAQAAPQAAVLVDEAYFEFHGETLIEQTRQVENLFVARTFSKAYGLAGLRIGVLAGDARQMRWSVAWPRPTASTRPRSPFCPRRFTIRNTSTDMLLKWRRNRERLQRELASLGLRCWPSHANFVLVHIGEAHAEFVQELRDARNSGARPALRPRMRRLRPPHGWDRRTHPDSYACGTRRSHSDRVTRKISSARFQPERDHEEGQTASQNCGNGNSYRP